ncbi:MAG: CRISPR-associated RAMP protein [bacterium]|uniref:CRISPR-associated RAMP protein n=1 Tax=Candidatus Methylomirabilis tolerans TaxID=3123416 RepID=A0AAJ1EKC1_9BACT|nr:CRISPR-associated RAMP protein [Candidatus Methylomirabilis sp.]
MATHPLDRSRLRSRYRFTGTLVLETALHIGGGREASTVTDSPIVRDGIGRPIIPGSSFKGAFRAGMERLVPNVGFKTCALDKANRCLSMNNDLADKYRMVSEAASRGIVLGVGNNDLAQREREALRALRREGWIGEELSESHLLDLLAEYLCDTCKTFGSVHLAAAARFHDLPVIEPWAETTQIRDGVGIDRDSERAVEQIKFDYEIVPAQTTFDFSMTLENPTERDLALIALGLYEFIEGMIPLGGIRSRGLGRCRLVDMKMAVVDFTQPGDLSAYLQRGWPEATPLGDFITRHIAALLPG